MRIVRMCNNIVILTKVRIQGNNRCRLRLWILTFVRMTGGCQNDRAVCQICPSARYSSDRISSSRLIVRSNSNRPSPLS